MSDLGFYRISDIENITGLSRRTIYKEMASGRFPGSIYITKGSKGWTKSSIHEWYEEIVKQ